MSVEELVERFAEIGVEQYEAQRRHAIPRFNRLYGLKEAVADELKGRPGDQRRALIRLYQHPNIQVQLNVAHAMLAVAPINARALLEAIRDSRRMPQAADAGMSLSALDRGEYKPT